MTDIADIEQVDTSQLSDKFEQFQRDLPNEVDGIRRESPAVCYDIGIAYMKKAEKSQRDISNALFWFLANALYNGTEAYYEIGKLYFSGLLKVPNHENRAFIWFRRAAHVEDGRAYYNLGLMYHRGYGTAIDKNRAYYYYVRGNEVGDRRCFLALFSFDRNIYDYIPRTNR